jgi:tetratricopeptide (TPR) repeat protein
VPVLVQASVAWRSLGSEEVALALLERAESRVDPKDHRQRGWVLHGKAKLLATSGKAEAAAATLGGALRAYRRAGDAYGECTASGIWIRIHRARGDFDAMLRTARRLRRQARNQGYEAIALQRRLDEARATVALGDAARGIVILREVLGEAVSAGIHQLEFHAHFHLWKAYEAAGDRERAGLERQSAQYFVRFVDEVSEEAEEIRNLPEV